MSISPKRITPKVLLVVESGKLAMIDASHEFGRPTEISTGIFTPLPALNDAEATGVATTEILVLNTPSPRAVTRTLTSLDSSDSRIKLDGETFTIAPKSSG